MRQDLPVTQQEELLQADDAIVSTTDLKGRIDYVNPRFLRISGFSRDELLGQPQNIVCHPDTPAAACEDMWRCLHAGQPWAGVKKRCKNGDYSWVKANITPVGAGAALAGFMSVPVQASRAEIAAASAAYQAVAQGRARLADGAVAYSGVGQLAARLGLGSLAMRIWASTSVVNLLMLGVCAMALGGASGAQPWLWRLILGGAALGLLINVYLWYTLKTSMLAPLRRAIAGARAIASGDLTAQFDTSSSNEMGQLMRALGQMNGNLMATVGDARRNIATMTGSTAHIAAGTQDLSARQIGEIIGLIEGIAFQTNILALNAAVEAARAGEQGRGFAVVAGEARHLAQRAAGAAKQVRALIEQSGSKVGLGMSQVQQVRATMEQVLGAVRKVTSIMGEISRASHEQSLGILQVNQAVARLDQVTQQNATLVEQAAASAKRFDCEGQDLLRAVSIFQLELAAAAQPARARSAQRRLSAPAGLRLAS